MNIKEFAQYVLDTVQDSVETNNTIDESSMSEYHDSKEHLNKSRIH